MSQLPDQPVTGGAPLLSVAGVSKAFGDNQVLQSVDLTVERGEVVAIIGASGSGKTTLLRCLNGLETPDAGVVRVGDVSVDFGAGFAGRGGAKALERARGTLRDQSAMVFQHYNLFPHRTVIENVVEGPVVVQGRAREDALEDARALLERVGLGDKADAYPHQLSGGQQQRVGIVRALALKPELLLFDEPTSALDPELVGDVLLLMRDLAAEGWTMVVVTHELQFAREVASKVAFVDSGAVLEMGPPAQVLGAPQEERTQQFVRRLTHPL
ncbi:amino acid ABC transporter ATP-binding protein [Demequina sp. B12]|uniref:amino acid ABC transporter ATP-binding protein n=1 Tax=Demequina sp. B12 TaxID=2992757 RepID=UPI00237B1352|nr:amino acid ABC transporter ATP-binding protein [Demequina sp. B12]MDE0572703.1 amino acid ABC transporter ATP-binding protein [Demequina sp. B12]